MEESLLEDRMCLQRIRLTRHLTQDLLHFNDMDIESACVQNHENETVQMLNSIIEEVNNEDGRCWIGLRIGLSMMNFIFQIVLR